MDGIIVINKPKEYTSHDIVAIIKKITKEKVGHTGTLDPNATGVLPLLIGKATQLSSYLINHDKTYIATLKLGMKTDTADGEGTVIEKKEVPPFSLEEINQVFKKFIGKQIQTPPMYSAVKVKGKKLYEYARQGKVVEVPKRQIEIEQLQLLEFKQEEAELVLEIACSKGTYIRTLCESIAESLHTVGYMKELERTKVGEFTIQQAIPIEHIQKQESLIEENIITIETFFKEKSEIALNDKEYSFFLNGVKLKKTNLTDDLYRMYYQHHFIGIGSIQNGDLKRKIVSSC